MNFADALLSKAVWLWAIEKGAENLGGFCDPDVRAATFSSFEGKMVEFVIWYGRGVVCLCDYSKGNLVIRIPVADPDLFAKIEELLNG